MKYTFKKYTGLDRWVSYWHQINEVLSLEPKSVLIVGKGDGIVPDVLKRYVRDVVTFDIDEALRPEIVGSVENMPFKDNAFDVILCAEVLEHLPFEKFEQSLEELARVSRGEIVLSLPHFGPPVKLSFKIPFLPEIKLAFKIPFRPYHKPGGVHFWEIGKKDYSPRKIRGAISKYFTILKDFVPFENQYHHFFVLRKR